MHARVHACVDWCVRACSRHGSWSPRQSSIPTATPRHMYGPRPNQIPIPLAMHSARTRLYTWYTSGTCKCCGCSSRGGLANFNESRWRSYGTHLSLPDSFIEILATNAHTCAKRSVTQWPFASYHTMSRGCMATHSMWHRARPCHVASCCTTPLYVASL